jgi:hypothetical protein
MVPALDRLLRGPPRGGFVEPPAAALRPLLDRHRRARLGDVFG